jgi:hypothetical protein
MLHRTYLLSSVLPHETDAGVPLSLLPLPPLFAQGAEPEAKGRLSMAKFVLVWSAATINAILLSAYAVIYTLVAAAYTWATYFNRHHFYLQAR